MIGRRAILAAIAAAGLSAACRTGMRPVVFDAPPADWERFAGEWRGEYTMNGRDRHGLIAFRLKAGPREAAGDVLMISDRFAWPYTGMPPSQQLPGQTAPYEAQLLSIRFVQADGGMVRGTMEPYWDRDRDCRAAASFLGSLTGHVIAGSFSTVCEDGVRTLNGRWRVERREAGDGDPAATGAARR
jgi:hypothetical protein